MKRLIFAAMLLFGSLTYGQLSVGIMIGAPPPPRVEVVIHRRAPDFFWIGGYWYPFGGRYIWHEGYWTHAPYRGARWMGPRQDDRYFHERYCEGRRGRMFHDHGWDKDRDRDFYREEHRR